MSRRRAAKPRNILPDVKFGSLMVAKFVNKMMYDGNKSVAEKHFYSALAIASKKANMDPLDLFQGVIEAVRPKLEVRSRRVGGATYQVPVEVRPSRALTLAMRWILAAARSRKGRSIVEKLSSEFLDALNKTGSAFKKCEDVGKMAEANRAYAHLRV